MYISQNILKRVLFANVFALTLNLMLFCDLVFRLWPMTLILAAIAEGLISLIWISWEIQKGGNVDI